VNIICDFDGTIALEDVTDSLLERFADESWKYVEAQWLAGKIGSRDCMARQVSLIEADHERLNRYLDTVEIDPSFSSFVDKCKRFDEINLHVVSDGIDYALKRILGNNKLSDLRVTANALVALPGNRYCLRFPHSKPDCDVQAGTCKCAIAQIRGKKRGVQAPRFSSGTVYPMFALPRARTSYSRRIGCSNIAGRKRSLICPLPRLLMSSASSGRCLPR